jgi:hypothetical protein
MFTLGAPTPRNCVMTFWPADGRSWWLQHFSAGSSIFVLFPAYLCWVQLICAVSSSFVLFPAFSSSRQLISAVASLFLLWPAHFCSWQHLFARPSSFRRAPARSSTGKFVLADSLRAFSVQIEKRRLAVAALHITVTIPAEPTSRESFPDPFCSPPRSRRTRRTYR